METEQIIMGLILNSGDAKGHLYSALESAKSSNYEEVDKKLKKAEEALNKAHTVQTQFLQSEASGEAASINALFVHAQDHLMTAMTEMTLIKEIIELRRELSKKN